MLFCLNFVQEKCCFEHFFSGNETVWQYLPTKLESLNKNKGHIQANEDITKSDKSHFIKKKIQHRHADMQKESFFPSSAFQVLCPYAVLHVGATSVFRDSWQR